jgi:hypothetical protein
MQNPDYPTPEQTTMRSSFTRSNFARVIHVDGAWGSITPFGLIYMALFSEHWPVPHEIAVGPNREGVVQEAAIEIPTHSQREIEVELMLSLQTATYLRDWLTEKLAAAQSMMESAGEQA